MTRRRATVLLADLERAGSTADTVEHALLEVPGVSRAYVNPATEAAYVEYDADQCSEADLVVAAESAGFHTLVRRTHISGRCRASKKAIVETSGAPDDNAGVRADQHEADQELRYGDRPGHAGNVDVQDPADDGCRWPGSNRKQDAADAEADRCHDGSGDGEG
jgi:copper chaperone CopZ